MKRGSATCPCCGYTTPVTSVRTQLKARRGGAHDAKLLAVVLTRSNQKGRFYRLPRSQDAKAVELAAERIRELIDARLTQLSPVPDEMISPNELRRISVPIYGITTWGDMFSPRQSLALATLSKLVQKVGRQISAQEATGNHEDAGSCSTSMPGLAKAVLTCLALAVTKHADANCANCTWRPTSLDIGHLFGRQAIGMVWDFAEVNPTSGSTRDFWNGVEGVLKALESTDWKFTNVGHVEQSSATSHPLPTDSVDGFITDPPYYDAVPYAYLSDFFYVWLRRILGDTYSSMFREECSPKAAEIVVDRSHHLSKSNKGIEFYERELQKAFEEGRRVLRPSGIGTIVFAIKTTSSWEAILKAVVEGGWIITGSSPIDTEMETRIAAQGQSRLASSVHLVCRPRGDSDGAMVESIGDWRDVPGELPKRIHEWMPRLAAEGVVGADAIFACLGPALEVFSRYSRVEKANGDTATLREYLEFVWAAISTEALSLIFKDAAAAGLEPDARLTAMWLWTLGGGAAKESGKRQSTPVACEGTCGIALQKIRVSYGHTVWWQSGEEKGDAKIALRGNGRRRTGQQQCHLGRSSGTNRREHGSGSSPPVDDSLRRRSWRTAETLPCRRRHRQRRPLLETSAVPVRPRPQRMRRKTLGGRRSCEKKRVGIVMEL